MSVCGQGNTDMSEATAVASAAVLLLHISLPVPDRPRVRVFSVIFYPAVCDPSGPRQLLVFVRDRVPVPARQAMRCPAVIVGPPVLPRPKVQERRKTHQGKDKMENTFSRGTCPLSRHRALHPSLPTTPPSGSPWFPAGRSEPLRRLPFFEKSLDPERP